MTVTVTPDLLGRQVTWSDHDGLHVGILVAMGTGRHGDFQVMILMDGRLYQREAHGLMVTG